MLYHRARMRRDLSGARITNSTVSRLQSGFEKHWNLFLTNKTGTVLRKMCKLHYLERMKEKGVFYLKW